MTTITDSRTYGPIVEAGDGTQGMLYLGGDLWIEDVETWPRDRSGQVPRSTMPRWYLLIGRDEFWDNDLATLEALLERYARAEGLL